MRYIKSCKEEHNPALGGPQIRLGTFQEYRELDPKFSNIADSEEGLTEIIIDANDLSVTQEQWNQVIGPSGAFSFGSKMRSYLAHTVQYNDGGASFSFGSDGKLTIKGSPFLRVTCPNVYMFCLSTKTMQPREIEKSYDSQYFIDDSNLPTFLERVSEKIIQQFSASSINHESSENMKELTLKCEPKYDLVRYVDEKALVLKSNEDFLNNTLLDRILSGMFEKNKANYQSDAEFRILFPIVNLEVGLIPVTKSPIYIDVDDSIRNLIGT